MTSRLQVSVARHEQLQLLAGESDLVGFGGVHLVVPISAPGPTAIQFAGSGLSGQASRCT